MEFPPYRTAHYDTGHHTVSISQPPSHDTKTVSSLQVKQSTLLSCDKEEDIDVLYTFVHEPKGSIDVVYLVSTVIYPKLSERTLKFSVKLFIIQQYQLLAVAVICHEGWNL